MQELPNPQQTAATGETLLERAVRRELRRLDPIDAQGETRRSPDASFARDTRRPGAPLGSLRP